MSVAIRHLQHWILAILLGDLRVHAARLISLINVSDEVCIQFSNIAEVDFSLLGKSPFT